MAFKWMAIWGRPKVYMRSADTIFEKVELANWKYHGMQGNEEKSTYPKNFPITYKINIPNFPANW